MRLRATVCGSFHRHLGEIDDAVRELGTLDVDVLSPSDPHIVDARGEFLFVASDRHRSVRLVEDRHLSAIALSDLVWLACPDGYVGSSAALEVGFARGLRTPVFAIAPPSDITIRSYVQVVPSLRMAVRVAQEQHVERPAHDLLVDPDAALDSVHAMLEELRRLLRGEVNVPPERLPAEVYSRASTVGAVLSRGR